MATCVSAHICSLHVVVLPVYVVVFSSRCGWWKAPPVSPATSSKVSKGDCYWVGGSSKLYQLASAFDLLELLSC